MTATVTHERLLELLRYDKRTGLFTWRVRRNQHVAAGDVAGTISKADGYRRINIGRKLYSAHRLAYFYVLGHWPEFDVDHRNGVRDDNRWQNLRPLTRAENMQNLQGAHRDNSTGLLGVAPVRNRFGAYIRIDGKNRYLGSFNTAQEAHEAYLQAKRAAHPAWNASTTAAEPA